MAFTNHGGRIASWRRDPSRLIGRYPSGVTWSWKGRVFAGPRQNPLTGADLDLREPGFAGLDHDRRWDDIEAQQAVGVGRVHRRVEPDVAPVVDRQVVACAARAARGARDELSVGLDERPDLDRPLPRTIPRDPRGSPRATRRCWRRPRSTNGVGA